MTNRVLPISLLPLLMSAACSFSTKELADDPDVDGPQDRDSFVGCGDGECVDGENIATCAEDCHAAVSPGTVVELDACVSDLSQGTIDENLGIVLNLEQSYHEMVACGQLTFLAAYAVSDMFATFLEGGGRGGVPEGLTKEEGVYVAAPGGFANARMELRFYYGHDYEVGNAGDLVTYNIFKIGKYLEGASLDFDYETFELLIRYDAPGPLVELLGYGTDAPRPIRLDEGDLKDLGFGRMKPRKAVLQDAPNEAVLQSTSRQC